MTVFRRVICSILRMVGLVKCSRGVAPLLGAGGSGMALVPLWGTRARLCLVRLIDRPAGGDAGSRPQPPQAGRSRLEAASPSAREGGAWLLGRARPPTGNQAGRARLAGACEGRAAQRRPRPAYPAGLGCRSGAGRAHCSEPQTSVRPARAAGRRAGAAASAAPGGPPRTRGNRPAPTAGGDSPRRLPKGGRAFSEPPGRFSRTGRKRACGTAG